MNILLSCVLALVGFGLTAASMERHSKNIKGMKKYVFRTAGWLLLAASVLPCIREWNAAVGIAAWFGIMSLMGSILVTALSFMPENKFTG
ncbi:DUF3325 domain-containing protein [Geovibrio thiophilus]|nr:DUF3325 domain-containing protein [Geovibrio thiophilus]